MKTQNPDPAGKNTPPILPEILRQLEELGEGFLEEASSIFLEDLDRRLGEMKQAVGDRDGVRVSQLAHSVKGMGANFGAWRLQALAQKIEEDCSAEKWSAIEALLKDLQEANREVQVALAPPVDGSAPAWRTV